MLRSWTENAMSYKNKNIIIELLFVLHRSFSRKWHCCKMLHFLFPSCRETFSLHTFFFAKDFLYILTVDILTVLLLWTPCVILIWLIPLNVSFLCIEHIPTKITNLKNYVGMTQSLYMKHKYLLLLSTKFLLQRTGALLVGRIIQWTGVSFSGLRARAYMWAIQWR